jgi:A/G-specific adenine glycosylase
VVQSALSLLEWWEGRRRDLPWRQTRDPWEVLVCEVMAQQTQVARVAARWRPFLDRFPTPAALAEAPVAEVIRWWTGLGYNRRALSLHRCAQAVVAEHNGRLPADLDALTALPGIGPYTARAVLAFAFEHDHGVVDTNTARVLARWEGRRLRAREVQAAADRATPAGDAWAWNQAMLDLGASVCTRRLPRCEECPVQGGCAWASAGWPAPDPADGSAGVSGGQSRFEGSDRQGRGRLVEALRHGAVTGDALPAVMGWPDDAPRARRIAATVVADGLATTDGRSYQLA